MKSARARVIARRWMIGVVVYDKIRDTGIRINAPDRQTPIKTDV